MTPANQRATLSRCHYHRPAPAHHPAHPSPALRVLRSASPALLTRHDIPVVERAVAFDLREIAAGLASVGEGCRCGSGDLPGIGTLSDGGVGFGGRVGGG